MSALEYSHPSDIPPPTHYAINSPDYMDKTKAAFKAILSIEQPLEDPVKAQAAIDRKFRMWDMQEGGSGDSNQRKDRDSEAVKHDKKGRQ